MEDKYNRVLVSEFTGQGIENSDEMLTGKPALEGKNPEEKNVKESLELLE